MTDACLYYKYNKDIQIKSYTNAAYATNKTARKSVSGALLQVQGGAIGIAGKVTIRISAIDSGGGVHSCSCGSKRPTGLKELTG